MKGWKTFGINLAIAVVGALTAAFAEAPLEPAQVGVATSILGGVNMVLRYVTTTPVFQGESN